MKNLIVSILMSYIVSNFNSLLIFKGKIKVNLLTDSYIRYKDFNYLIDYNNKNS
jgi:hypothetical protein